MSILIERIRQCIPKDVFCDHEIELLETDSTDASRRNKLCREVAKGNLHRLMRGVYILAKKYQRLGIHPFEVAQYLLFPCYVSLESALSHYQLIPETVYTTTSVTTRRSKSHATPLGEFTFVHLPQHAFRQGFIRQKENRHLFLIANPLKALLDYVYVHKKDYNALDDFQEDLRLNLETFREHLRSFTNREIQSYTHVFNRHSRIVKVVDIIIWELL